MNRKYVNIKKLILTTALLSTISAQSVLGYALDRNQVEAKPVNIAVETGTEIKATYDMKTTLAGARNFPDLAGFMWAKPAIDAMVAKGIIVGNEDGTFRPGANVTRQEFAAMAINAFGDIDKMIVKADELAKTQPYYTSSREVYAKYPNNWAKKVIAATQVAPMLHRTWDADAESWEKNATRGDMAIIVMSIAEANGQTFNTKDRIENNLEDFTRNVKGTMAEAYILKAYSNGILVGDENGNFNPQANALRADAAVIMNAAVNPSARANVVVKEKVNPPFVEGSNIGKYAVYPKEGDVINGVTVTRDPQTGVLGFGNGQKGGIYLGTEILNKNTGIGYTIQVGSTAAETYGGMVSGDKYQEKHGYIFWGHEWEKIEGVASRRAKNQVQASASTVGTKCDIYGNILKAGDTAPAFFEVKQVLDYYSWLPTH